MKKQQFFLYKFKKKHLISFNLGDKLTNITPLIIYYNSVFGKRFFNFFKNGSNNIKNIFTKHTYSNTFKGFKGFFLYTNSILKKNQLLFKKYKI